MATTNQNEERPDNGTSGQPTRGKGSSNPKKPNKKARGQKGDKKKKGFNGHVLSTSSAMHGVTLTQGGNLPSQFKFFIIKVRHAGNTCGVAKVGLSLLSLKFLTESEFVTATMDHSKYSKTTKVLVDDVWVDKVVITNKIVQAQETHRWGIQYKMELQNFEAYREQMYKFFYMIPGQCDGQVTTALESHKEWKEAEKEKDPCKVLIILRSVCTSGLTDANADVIIKSLQAIKRALNLHQNQTSSSDYEKGLTGNIESFISQDQDLFLGWTVWKMAMDQLSLTSTDVNDYYKLGDTEKAMVRKRVTELIVSRLLVLHGKNSYLRNRCAENQAMGHLRSYEDDPKKVVAMLDTIQPPSKSNKNINNDNSNEKDKTMDTTAATKKQVGLHICEQATGFAGNDDDGTMEDMSNIESSTTLDNDDDRRKSPTVP